MMPTKRRRVIRKASKPKRTGRRAMSTKPQIIPPDFDYRVLPEEDRGYIKTRADGIREAGKRTGETICLIGQWLTEAKARIPHGYWLPWLKTEFGWSQMTANRFMNVYEQFKL